MIMNNIKYGNVKIMCVMISNNDNDNGNDNDN